MTPIIVRIALRYIAGALVFKGLIDSDMGTQLASDPDLSNLVNVAIGLVAGSVSEAWYWLARRFGWAK